MKSIQSVISHLKKSSSTNKINEFRCFASLKSLLPKRFQNHINFIYKREETLFFVLNHPALKTELNYNHNMINTLLKQLIRIHQCEVFNNIQKIKSFVTNRIPKKTKQRIIEQYNERSSGEFEIKVQNDNIKEIFQRIRDRI